MANDKIQQQPKTYSTFELDTNIVSGDNRLSVVKEKIENLLKPFQHTLVIRTEERNGKIKTLRIETEINL